MSRAFVDELCAACGIVAQRDVLIIPGNHDIPLFNLPLRVLDPYGPYVRAFGKRLEPLIRRPDVWLIGVNTTRPWRHKHGELSSAQIERVAARLRAAPAGRAARGGDAPAVVRGRARRSGEPRARTPFGMRVWATAGADLLLGGHIHQSFVAPLTAPMGGCWVVQTGTAVSSCARARTQQRAPDPMVG